MNIETVKRAAEQFPGMGAGISIEQLGNGLIHRTYKVTDSAKKKSIVLQAININVFKDPQSILHNYNEIYQYLRRQENAVIIPAPVPAKDGQLLWKDDEKNYWRATEFIDHSYSPMMAMNEEAAYTVAKSFAGFTHSLAGLDIQQLEETLSDFHNLSFRYRQFEEAITKAPVERLLKSTHVIAELRQRKKLVIFYETIQHAAAYPDRAMHHDCKISNILFDTNTDQVICPVDLDTVMPGKFFSDIGDMIRSMACTVDENSAAWEEISIRPAFYTAILQGYREGIGDIFTQDEKKDIHYSGLILIFMQALRFVSDFLIGDVYYKTSYPEQNLNRALNQLILLERLEDFLLHEYSFKVN